jgi:hypothetical protein
MEYRGIPVSQIKLNHGERIVELLMDTIREYRTDNFGKAGVNREISVKCEKYYLVNVHWLDWDRDVIEKYTGIRLDA